MKGHLDYMRQMDTILVAVGVPTKEVPGASFALPQSAAVTKETVDIPDQTTNEQPAHVTQNPAEKTETRQSRDEPEDEGDGWDIPDISDLLDSLNETESESQTSVQNSVSEDKTTSNETDRDSNVQCDLPLEESDPDEHVSWSWDDSHWTTENK